ncbi:MAG: FlhC family transcriptional regulator [Pseudomonadota bacterium]|nr:FlhC family transcriptional regulator [Pseudomonadota bacterium]
MSILGNLERLELAIELLQRKARVSIVHHETGVSRPKLRALHRELHGRGATCGQILPAIGGATIETRYQQVHAGVFAAFYEIYAGPDLSRQLDIRAVITAHDFYGVLLAQDPQIDCNSAWVIARDLRVGTSELRSCGACELRYLVSSASRLAPTCPFCVLHPRRGRRGEPRLVLPAGLAAPSADADIDALLTPPGEDR